MKILLSGKNGQVGYELERSLQPLGDVIALDRNQMDLANYDQLRSVIREIKPNLIVNAAAYTAVDKAESEPKLAMRINGVAPGIIAEEAARLNAAMIHYSTDYVFNGSKKTPYVESDKPCPINEYGRTKLAGEQAIQAAGIEYFIFRTSWVYSAHGKNFLNTISRLAKSREQLSIVADQYGAPTWSRTISDTTAQIICKTIKQGTGKPEIDAHSGVYHLTAQGETSWYELARYFFELSGNAQQKITPITTEEFVLPAQRPKNSRLSCELLMRKFCHLPDWKVALALCKS